MSKLLYLLVFFVISLLFFLIWASYPWSMKQQTFLGDILKINNTEDEQSSSTLKIVTWNLAYAYGLGSEGNDYEFKEKEFFEKKLDLIAQTLIDSDAHIICLQEIDINSQRTHYIDQVKYLAQKTGHNFIAYAPSWTANYIPFPYFPLKNQFGKMNSGGAILSKYPIVSNQVYLFAKPKNNPWWYNLFYLHRYTQVVEFVFNQKSFILANTHLEAFDNKSRHLQIEEILNLDLKHKFDWIVGDFNTIPTHAQKKDKFNNSTDEYVGDLGYKTIIRNFLDVIPEDIYKLNEELFYTFPANKPDRKLDYIFYQKDLKFISSKVLSVPNNLSDHLPLEASFQLMDPIVNPYSL